MAERGKGARWRDIAERAELSERQCRRIFKAHMRSQPTRDHDDLVAELDQALIEYDTAIAELALLSMTTGSDCARVSAIRARLNARWRKLELLRVAGVLGDVRYEVDVHAITNAVVAAFDQHRIPDDARRAVLAALGPGAATSRTGLAKTAER